MFFQPRPKPPMERVYVCSQCPSSFGSRRWEETGKLKEGNCSICQVRLTTCGHKESFTCDACMKDAKSLLGSDLLLESRDPTNTPKVSMLMTQRKRK